MGGWRLKSRLNGLRPRSPPARTAQTLPVETHSQERISVTCVGRFRDRVEARPFRRGFNRLHSELFDPATVIRNRSGGWPGELVIHAQGDDVGGGDAQDSWGEIGADRFASF